MRFFTIITMQTRLQFKIVRVKLLFFPTMTKWTSILKIAAILIRSNKVFSMPIFAHFMRICKYRRFSSIILPIMSVNAHISFMVILPIRTPNCFEMENIKVHIRLKLLYQLNWQFSLIMSKGTEFTIFAFSRTTEIGGTELRFVFVRMIKLFNSIMRFITAFSICTFLVMIDVPALFWLIKS